MKKKKKYKKKREVVPRRQVTLSEEWITPDIEIYTDGGVANNGSIDCHGKSSFIILNRGILTYENTVQINNTTNNRVEMQAIINALNYLIDNNLQDLRILIRSDSQYCVNGFNKWSIKWKELGWKQAAERVKPVINDDLWIALDSFKSKFKKLKLIWVKGHSGDKWNDYVDSLCTMKSL